jgi:UDP-N-acetylmuramate dehydrogenase
MGKGTDRFMNLPIVQGRYTHQTLLSKITWFQVGGPAEVLFKPKDVQDLSTFLNQLQSSIPILTLGVGSNLLVRDGGIDGVVIRLGGGFNEILIFNDEIEVGSAVLDRNIAMHCASFGIGGLEFLCSIPGTLGGAIKMNAGCYGREIKDVLLWVDIMARDGKIERRHNCEFTYRHSNVQDNEIVIKARLKGNFTSKDNINACMQEMLTAREQTQPVHTKTGGSTFANPPGHKAWELIDRVGGRGMRKGGAQVSQLHCNFLVNTGDATAKDLEDLGENIRFQVLEKFNIDLRWEICKVGKP